MNCIVSGGSGFIGSHIVDLLLEKGHRVKIIDIAEPIYPSAAEYVNANVLDLEAMIRETRGAEIIFHLAAEANVNYYYDKPVYSSELNTQGVVKVCEAARQNGVKRVIFASTEWVYQASNADEVDEDTPLYPPACRHIYSASKLAAELYLQSYQLLYGVDFSIVRYGIPFGDRARPETVHPIFINKALKGEEITIHGDGMQFRQFVYVKDLAAGNVACLDEKARNQIFDINGSEKVTVVDIVHTIEKILGIKANYQTTEERAGSFKGRFITSKKAREILNWKPRYTYYQAMENYLKWYKKNVGE